VNMNMALESNDKRQAKTVLVVICGALFILVALFFAVLKLSGLSGWPAYFAQAALYVVMFLLAFWGLKKERISLPVNAGILAAAVILATIGWLLYALLLQITGMASVPDEIRTLISAPAWKVTKQIVMMWLFVGMGEELLFRGYILEGIQRHFARGEGRRRTVAAVLISSMIFSLWHIPQKLFQMAAGNETIESSLLGLVVAFILGIGFAYLFIRARNIILVGLVHGLMDFPLIGFSAQISPFILIAVIGCVEIYRWLIRGKPEKTPRAQ
jgi:membrane protease YdiL (CAAX protease family)